MQYEYLIIFMWMCILAVLGYGKYELKDDET